MDRPEPFGRRHRLSLYTVSSTSPVRLGDPWKGEPRLYSGFGGKAGDIVRRLEEIGLEVRDAGDVPEMRRLNFAQHIIDLTRKVYNEDDEEKSTARQEYCSLPSTRITNEEREVYTTLWSCMVESQGRMAVMSHNCDGINQDRLSDGEDNIPDTEVVVTIAVYHARNAKIPSANHQLDSMFSFLGSQKLTALRDIISCSSDNFVTNDVSEDLSKEPVLLKDEYPSAFLYINGIFYDDRRNINAWELEEPPIITKHDGLKRRVPLQKAKMEETCFKDLICFLGFPYDYVHLNGTCNHKFEIVDVRLMHPSDSPKISSYPVILHRRQEMAVYCHMCTGSKVATWEVCDLEFMNRSCSRLCCDCFLSLCYTVDGEKVSNFKAFPFIQTTLDQCGTDLVQRWKSLEQCQEVERVRVRKRKWAGKQGGQMHAKNGQEEADALHGQMNAHSKVLPSLDN